MTRLVAFALAGALIASLAPRAFATEPPPPRVVIHTDRGEVPVSVQLARRPGELQVGLMYRLYMPPGLGMLFIMPREQIHSFWMRNTLIPLDMIFINVVEGEHRVVGIVESAEPLTDTPRWVRARSRFVLEVRGGWTRAMGVSAGQRVDLRGVGL